MGMDARSGALRGTSAAFPGLVRRLPVFDGLAVAVAAAFVLGTAFRFGTGGGQPLWIDEAFTGAIALQPDLAGLLHQLHADVNAPLYYVVMHLWSVIAGVSNAALRLPSVLFATAAVLLALRGTARLDRCTCLVWGSFLGLWAPGLHQASEARCYPLLLLLSTALTLALVRLVAEPSRRAAFAWAALGALTVLTHYLALPLVVAQGLVFLARHRSRALRCWPALAAFLPALGWIVAHAPRLAAFGNPDLAWYGLLDAADLPAVAAYVLGLSGLLVLTVALVLALVRRRQGPAAAARNRAGGLPGDRADDAAVLAATAALAALLGLAVLVLAGTMRPSFIPRYGVPYVPGLLLGLAVAVRWAAPAWPRFPAVAVLLFAVPVPLMPAPERPYSFEAASEAVARAGARRLVFYWDHPSSTVQDPAQMRAVGGFFLARAGHPVAVTALANPWREDPQPRLLAAVGPGPDTAILWLYDGNLPKTAALAHPPRIEAIDPAWRCRNHAAAPFVALLCLRAPS